MCFTLHFIATFKYYGTSPNTVNVINRGSEDEKWNKYVTLTIIINKCVQYSSKGSKYSYGFLVSSYSFPQVNWLHIQSTSWYKYCLYLLIHIYTYLHNCSIFISVSLSFHLCVFWILSYEQNDQQWNTRLIDGLTRKAAARSKGRGIL